MKVVLLFIALFFSIGLRSFAQTHISTSMRSDYNWDAKKQEWIWVSNNENEKTFFEFNQAVTLLKHTTPTITSTYIIKSGKEDKTTKILEYEVTSDVGNNYTLILDVKNNNIRFVGTKKDGNLFLVQHTIKKMWVDGQ